MGLSIKVKDVLSVTTVGICALKYLLLLLGLMGMEFQNFGVKEIKSFAVSGTGWIRFMWKAWN